MSTFKSDADYRDHYDTHTRSNSWWLKDGHGIECCRVCPTCEDYARSLYDPRIFAGQYDADEAIEPS